MSGLFDTLDVFESESPSAGKSPANTVDRAGGCAARPSMISVWKSLQTT